jgi:hypothetical protein
MHFLEFIDKLKTTDNEVFIESVIKPAYRAIAEVTREYSGELTEPSDYNIDERFDYWNDKLFGGELPKPILRWVKSGPSGSMGFLKQGRGRAGVMLPIADGWKLSLNGNSTRKYAAWDSILIHEMTHLFFQSQYVGKPVYLYSRALGNGGHGPRFQAKIKELTEQTGIHITMTDDREGIDLDSDLPDEVAYVLFQQRSGGQIYGVTFRPDAINAPNKLHAIKRSIDNIEKRSEKVAFGVTTLGAFRKLPLARGSSGITSYRNMPDTPEVNELLNKGITHDLGGDDTDTQVIQPMQRSVLYMMMESKGELYVILYDVSLKDELTSMLRAMKARRSKVAVGISNSGVFTGIPVKRKKTRSARYYAVPNTEEARSILDQGDQL